MPRGYSSILVWVLTIKDWVPLFMGRLLSMGANYPHSMVYTVDIIILCSRDEHTVHFTN